MLVYPSSPCWLIIFQTLLYTRLLSRLSTLSHPMMCLFSISTNFFRLLIFSNTFWHLMGHYSVVLYFYSQCCTFVLFNLKNFYFWFCNHDSFHYISSLPENPAATTLFSFSLVFLVFDLVNATGIYFRHLPPFLYCIPVS